MGLKVLIWHGCFSAAKIVVLRMGTNKKITAWAQLLMILAATAYPSPQKILSIFHYFERYFHDFCSIFVILSSRIVP